ncbi:phosphoribosylanthranilate isomerase [Granulicella aggregans]|jgi:phosphoribosylanthranilate isomerase|uniref:phosphoribosylanthranilate isomerase n=1 Tax=Granulicella aggregans TaxID=474949 RepID=UPI0021E07C5C|nr:phosphoribosylanthranilate isomerase [Granulicella aggregans]
MWIKFCANTNLEDALIAAELGANAVGFVFAPSKRQVTAAQVAAITPHLPSALEKIGVFMSADALEIAEIVRSSGLTGVQLHGAFDAALVRLLREHLGEDISITQTVHWEVDGKTNNAEDLAAELKEIAQEPAIDHVLIDSKSAKGAGGTGVSFDWSEAREALAQFQGRLIVAGGLHPANVAAAIAALNPWGVDVASGVEAEPGRKDRQKLMCFIDAARNARPRASSGPYVITQQT